MKSFRNHLMLILPLMAILLGIEFFLVFERITKSYEYSLTKGYTLLVVANKPMSLSKFKSLNSHISSAEEIPQKTIVHKMAKGMTKDSMNQLVKSLPHFYNVGLDSYLKIDIILEIKEDLDKERAISRIETFNNSYVSNYNLFSFIKLIFNIFIIFMIIVSILLILKQMEVWKYKHRERMEVMEILGASVGERSSILFVLAIVDATLSTLLVSGIFLAIKLKWAMNSGIEIISSHQEFIFTSADIVILFVSSIVIVLLAVAIVVSSSKGISQ